jgi:hypothetical protein
VDKIFVLLHTLKFILELLCHLTCTISVNNVYNLRLFVLNEGCIIKKLNESG